MPESRKTQPPAPDPETSSGIPVQTVYTPDNLAGWNADEGYPGDFPYTRGVQPTMYRGRLWTMRQYAGMGDAEESNKRYKYLLANGTSGLSVAFDLPTQIGWTATTRWRWAKWVKLVWRSIPSRTCSAYSTASTSRRFR